MPNDHIYQRPQVNNKQVYAEQRPKPYLVNPVEPIQQPQQPFKSSPEVSSSGYFQKYPGHVENQNLFPQISNFARPFEQTNDHNVFIKPNQYVHNLNVGTEVRFGQEHGVPSTRPISLDLPTTGFTHPATRPFSKFQTPSPKNEELYRIFPVKEVNALPTFLPTPITLGQVVDGRPKVPYFKETAGGSSEYDAREEQDENESGEQYDIMKNPTKPMITSTTTTTTTTTIAPPRVTRKRKPSTTTTTTVAPEEYEEYVVPNHPQEISQVQEHQQEYNLQQEYQPQEDYRHRHEYEITSTTEAPERPIPPLVNKYKKKKPFPSSRPKEPQQSSVEELDFPERMTLGQSPAATVATTITTTPVATTTIMTTTTTTSPQSSAETTAATDARAKIKLKYGNGSRPRFSIKDYKTTTTTTTSTEKAPSVAGRRSTTTTPVSTDPETVEHQQTTSSVRKPYKPRPRPNRYKMSSTTSTTTTTEEVQQQETTTERVIASGTAYRSKYKPGKYYNRLRTSTESATMADEGGEQVVATEPTKPAVYSAKRRTVSSGKTATAPMTTAVTAAEESNALALRRSSSISPPEVMDAAASSEDVDYVATTVAVTPLSSPKHRYHTSYVAERPLLPIESFFQSSMTSKRYHNERR